MCVPMGVGYMNKNVRLHFIKMLFVLVVTVLAISVFGYTNVYGQNILFDTNSVVKVVKDITIRIIWAFKYPPNVFVICFK